jgi:hypothetical protein
VEELRDDLEDECSKLGPLEKITVFDRHPEGVVIIKFGTAFAAEQCIKTMNGRYFGGRKLQCIYWDGVTDFTKTVYRDPTPSGPPGEGPPSVAHHGDEEDDEDRRLDEFGDELDNQVSGGLGCGDGGFEGGELER